MIAIREEWVGGIHGFFFFVHIPREIQSPSQSQNVAVGSQIRWRLGRDPKMKETRTRIW